MTKREALRLKPDDEVMAKDNGRVYRVLKVRNSQAKSVWLDCAGLIHSENRTLRHTEVE